MPSKRLCLNMIVRNEVANIERCLASVAGYIDCWVIGDTGSTDGTQDFITAFFRDRGIPGELHNFPFENFEQARNEALARAVASPLSFDYLLFTDADMELVVEDAGFRDQLDAPAYNVRQRAGISYWNTRLVQRHANARYRGVTHEYIEVAGAVRQLGGIWYIDHASGSNRVDKFERDIRLIQQALEMEPNNVRYWFYLAQSYRDAGRRQEAADIYAKRAAMGGWDEEAWYARLQEARCLRQLGDEAGFVRQALAAFNQRPHRAEPLYDLTRYYRERGMNAVGMLFCEAGLALPRPEQDVLFVEDYVYAAGFREEYAILAFYSPDAARKARGFEVCNRLALDREAPKGTRDLARSNLFYYVAPASSLMPSFAAQRIDFIPPDGYHAMNPSVARRANALVTVQRTVNFTVSGDDYKTPDGEPVNTRNFLLDLNDDLTICSAGEILPPDDWPEPKFGLVRGFEDMRLFAWRDALWCTATVRELSAEGWCDQVLAQIDGRAPGPYRLRDWRVLRPGVPRQHEKNWMPQVSGDDLRFFYSCDPTRVVDECGEAVDQPAAPLAAENFRGGSQAIRFDGGWLAVIHEVLWRDQRRFYQHRFVWFDGSNELRRLTRPFVLREKGIEYAAGLAWHPDERRLVLSFGLGDAESWLATVDASEVRAALEGIGTARSVSGPEPAAPARGAADLRHPDQAVADVKERPSSPRGGAVAQDAQARSPVFLHASWRTGSTWFWGRFRKLPETLCYYEPYHSANVTITRQQAAHWDSKSWSSGHPALAPYWREYLPLIRKSGGIRLFDPAIPYGWFIPIGGLRGELRPAEKRYLALLLRRAERRDRVAVLGLNGSLGRIAALKSTFGGTHVFQYRNLWNQWLSYISYARQGNPVFFQSTAFVINRTDDPYFNHLREDFSLRAAPGENKSLTIIQRLLSLSETDTFSMFMAMHLYLYLHATLSADISIDVSQMAQDAGRREAAENEIAARTGLAVSFADVREERHPELRDLDLGAIDWEQICKEGGLAARHFVDLAPIERLNSLVTGWIDAAHAEMMRARDEARPPAAVA